MQRGESFGGAIQRRLEDGLRRATPLRRPLVLDRRDSSMPNLITMQTIRGGGPDVGHLLAIAVQGGGGGGARPLREDTASSSPPHSSSPIEKQRSADVEKSPPL
jgi:hypothetical protein